MTLAEALERSRVTEKASDRSLALVEDRFHHLPHVLSARAGDTTVLMDRKRGTYFTLNEMSGMMWELLGSGATVSELVKRLVAAYDVNLSQLQADVANTVRQFLTNGLIAPGPMPVSAPATECAPNRVHRRAARDCGTRVPSVLRCGLMIFVVKAMLKARGFTWTMDWVRRQVVGVVPVALGDVEAMKRVEHAVAVAGAVYPGRALCLEQSLVLYYLLRRQGVGVSFCSGVQPHPFLAHVWVDHGGVALNDVPEHVRQFARLPSLLP